MKYEIDLTKSITPSVKLSEKISLQGLSKQSQYAEGRILDFELCNQMS